MTDPSPIRVVLVDDQQLFREGVAIMIDAQPDMEVVGRASDGQESLEVIAASEPDVVLMDIRMPVMDGVAATRELFSPVATAARTKPLKVVVLTTFNLDLSAATAIRLGASGFLLKDTRPAELLSAVRAVAAGDAAVSPRVTQRMLELFGSRMPDPAASALDSLTPREHEILLAIAEGLTNGEIGERFVLSESTVKTHVGRVLMKLELRDRVQAVIFAFEHGLAG